MKKKFLALAAGAAMTASCVGCTSEGTALIKEFEKVSAWEGVDQAGNMTMEMKAGDENVKLELDYTAYTNSEKVQMEMTVQPKAIEVNGEKLDLTKGDYKFSPVKFYTDGAKGYISTSYFTDIFKVAGASEDELKEIPMDLSKEYIMMDIAGLYKDMGIDFAEMMANSQAITKEFYSELAKSEIKCPIKQEDHKYTINLSADDMVQILSNAVSENIKEKKDELEKEYKKMGLTDEEIKETMATLEVLADEESQKMIKETIKGSNAKVVLAYEDGKQTTDFSFNLNVNVLNEKIAIGFTMKDEAKKAKAKEIKMPTSYSELDMNAFMQAELEAEKEVVEEVKAEEAKEEKATAETKASETDKKAEVKKAA